MASPYASAAKIASAEANLGGPIALDSSLLLKQLVVALGNVTGGGGGSGTVTSIAQSFTGGLISVSGSPVTTSGTLALTVAGTSGGIPYFSSTSTWASSAALAANALVVGGGAGAAPSTVTTGTGVVTALGVNVGTAGAFVVNGGALGTPSSGTLTNCTGIPAAGITGTLPAANGGTGVANGASCSLTLPNAATTITTGGTIALGGFTLTVPATGTTALLGTTNVFSIVQNITFGIAAATQGNGLVLTNSTAATNGNQTWSPSLRLTGNQFASSASRTCEWIVTAIPVQQNFDHSILRFATKHGSDAAINLIDFRNYNSAPFIESSGTITIGGNGGNAGTLLQFNGTPYIALATNSGAGSFVVATGCITIGSGGYYGGNNDLHLTRKAAAALQLGVDAAGVTNQLFTAANRITSDGVGANLTIAAGNGRGAAGGSLILSTFTTAGAGTAGTLTSRLTIDTSGNIALPNVTAVTTETVVSDRTWPISINGVTYKICLKA